MAGSRAVLALFICAVFLAAQAPTAAASCIIPGYKWNGGFALEKSINVNLICVKFVSFSFHAKVCKSWKGKLCGGFSLEEKKTTKFICYKKKVKVFKLVPIFRASKKYCHGVWTI